MIARQAEAAGLPLRPAVGVPALKEHGALLKRTPSASGRRPWVQAVPVTDGHVVPVGHLAAREGGT